MRDLTQRSIAVVISGAVLLAGCGGDEFVTAEPGSSGGSPGSGGSATGGGPGPAGSGGATSTGGSATGGTSAGGSATGGTSTGGSVTGGTGGSVAGGTGGVVVTGGTGGTPGTEICLNGVDDDDNGLADCLDPACQQAFTCVPAPPSGWIGVGWVVQDPDAECPPEYPSSERLFRLADLLAPAPECTCECGDPTDATCAAMLYCDSGQNCANETPDALLVEEQCAPLVDPGGAAQPYASCWASTPFATGGACEAVARDVVAAWSWDPRALACLRAEVGVCEADAVCVPQFEAAATRPCIASEGDVSCPEPYIDRAIYYDGQVVDGRGCQPCTCSAPSGSLCECESAGTDCLITIRGGECTGTELASVPADGISCESLTNSPGATNVGVQLSGAVVSSVGRCTAADTGPVGLATPLRPLTVCCHP